MKKVIRMKFKKSTKGTHVFEQIEPEDPIIPSVYIKRTVFSDTVPTVIDLELRVGE